MLVLKSVLDRRIHRRGGEEERKKQRTFNHGRLRRGLVTVDMECTRVLKSRAEREERQSTCV
jgi:hypothetical protein